MPVWSLAGVSTGLMTTMTVAEAEGIVAACVGGQDRPNEVRARDALNLAISKLNTYTWEYKLVQGTDVNVVEGTATYPLPSDFRAPYDLRMTSDGRSLTYVDRKNWSLVRQDQTSQSTPYFYTLFNSSGSGNVELLPIPGGADTMEVRYYSPIDKAKGPDAPVDVTKYMERAVILLAQELVVLWRSPSTRMVSFYAGRAEDALREALQADREAVDTDVGFHVAPLPSWPETHPNFWE